MKLKSLLLLLTMVCVQFIRANAISDPILQAAIDAIKIPNADNIRGNITLPKNGTDGITYTWFSGDSTIIRTTEGGGYNDTITAPGGIVSRQATDTIVKLTVTGLRNGITATRTIEVTVKAKKAMSANTAYLYVYFSGDNYRIDDPGHYDHQQIYFSVSKDGITWDDLNENNPILTSVLGDKGVRDHYLIRSPEGDRFFLIATDLDIFASKYGGDWGKISKQGSTSLMIWESTDLVNWSAQRMVDMASSIGAGSAWAPEAIYDEKTGEYLVFWSSVVSADSYAKYRIYISKTRDFVTFTKPALYVEGPKSNIDASICKINNTFYRFIKDEVLLSVSLSSGNSLLNYSNKTGLGNSFSHVQNDELESYNTGYEGPAIFQFINENKWCVLVDEYGGSRRGYIPFISSNIAAANSLHLLADGTYLMPTGAKHGAVIQITQQEYDSLTNKWKVAAPAENVSTSPILKYDFEEVLANATVADKSGNGNNAKLFGNATYVTDSVKGKVLYLNATTGTYLQFPQGFFDGRGNMTISMDIKPNMDTQNHFTFTIGKNTSKYMFLKTSAGAIRNAITTQSYAKERIVSKTGSFKGVWVNVKIVMEGHKMSFYLDNKLVQSNNYVHSVNDLGKGLLSYLGKSFYNDPYFNGYFDNVQVYNRALTETEILTGLNDNVKKENDLVTVYMDRLNRILFVKLNGDLSKKSTIEIFDISGQKIAQKEMERHSSDYSLYMGKYSSGMYIVRVANGYETVSEKIIN